MKFLHLSDIHFTSITLNPVRLLSKRLLGMGNVILNRQFQYKPILLEPILKKVPEVDQVWITGDLTTTAMPEEFAQAVIFLKAIQHYGKEILLVPGNHDRYTAQSRHEKSYEHELQDFLKSRESFPFIQVVSDSLVLIGLDATDPINWLSAAGHVTETQYQKLEAILADPEIQARRIVLLCHYPIVYPEGFQEAESHKLADRERLTQLLQKYGVSLYLHGHTHRQWILPANAQHPLIVNAGSATKKKGGGHVLFEIGSESIKIYPYLHDFKEGWKAQEMQQFPFLPAKERRPFHD
ncbi:MAG: metallophosphoesterase [Planctomycetota bacterium]